MRCLQEHKSVQAKKRCHARRIESAHRPFIDFPELFGPRLFYLPQLF
jgi:hypothetical protein